MARVRFALVALMLSASVACFAKPEFWDLFERHYKPAADSAIGQGKCVTCHVAIGTTRRNPYGKSLQTLVEASSNQELTEAMLQQVESQDSDGDGFSNDAEIKAGTLPGDPTSHPGAVTSAAPPKAASPPLIPEHSFHPLIVHFPIGIYIFGALLEMWGLMTNRKDARSAARFPLVVGTFSTVLAVGTGIVAMYRMGRTLEGTLFYHLISGVAACILALAIVAWRWKKQPETPAYWVILFLSVVAMTLAGHFGASMVWG